MSTLLKCGIALLTLAAWHGPAQAWTGKVSWPTFYRAGPGRNYTVLDELDRGETLEVLSCGNGWCQVRYGHSVGYTEQEWITRLGAMLEKPATSGTEGCVRSRVTGSGYKNGLDYQFCPRDTQVSIPSGVPTPRSAVPGRD